MPCPPDLVNYLVVEISETPGFENPLTQVLPSSATMFPVNGAFDTPKYVRAKWRRSTDPLDEGPWSNVLLITFLKLTPDEVDGTPGATDVERPPVPVIRSVYGWTEFIELVMLGGPQAEGALIAYGCAQATQNGGSCIYIKNLSSDPSISIVEAALIIGEPYPQVNCDGDKTIVAGFHPNDPFETGNPIVDVSNYAPYIAAPPEADFAVPSGQIQYHRVAKTPPDGVTPGHPDYDCLASRCPDPGDPGYNAAYACTSVYDVAKTQAGFDLPGGGNYYVKVDSGIARAYQTYVNALGRTVFPPLLGVAIGGVGIFASFTQVGSVYVKFSTGLELYHQALDLSQDLGGFQWDAQADAELQLDDFFVFISETPFSDDLDAASWQDAVINNDLPTGVHLVMVSRSTNLLVSNIGGQRLDPPKTPEEWPEYNKSYYFRVGARRPTDSSQTSFVYSETLSEQATGRLGSMSKLAQALGLVEPQTSIAGDTWKEPVDTAADLPATGITGDTRLVIDENAIYSYVGGLWRISQATLEVVGEIVWGVSTLTTGVTRGFRPTIPKGIVDGTLTGWCLKCDTAGNGDTVVDINLNGTTIFTTQANRPKLTSGQTKSTGTAIDVVDVSSEDDLTLDIDSLPGSVPVKLTAILYFKQSAQLS